MEQEEADRLHEAPAGPSVPSWIEGRAGRTPAIERMARRLGFTREDAIPADGCSTGRPERSSPVRSSRSDRFTRGRPESCARLASALGLLPPSLGTLEREPCEVRLAGQVGAPGSFFWREDPLGVDLALELDPERPPAGLGEILRLVARVGGGAAEPTVADPPRVGRLGRHRLILLS
jgi:hypothetical protein